MADDNFDVYGNLSWTERARYGAYGVALDCGDVVGKKNHFLDNVHQIALRQTLEGLYRYYERALDFGCGGGRLLPLLSKYAAQVYGIDRTPVCIEMARAAKIIPEERLFRWREGTLPFADGFFDLFLSAYVLLTSAALDAMMPHLARVTRARGNGILLEQLDNGRELTLDHYHNAFNSNGFSVVREFPIRRSTGSRWMQLGASKRCPPALSRFAARREIASSRKLSYGAQTPGYYDCIFVLERR